MIDESDERITLEQLSRSQIDAYWDQISPMTGNILASMSACDDWALNDNPDIQKQLTSVMNAIVDSKDGFQEIKHFLPALITILNYLDTSTSLWLQIWLNSKWAPYDVNSFEALTKVALDIIREPQETSYSTSNGVQYATKDDAKLFLQRSYAFSKMSVFSQIFSEERLDKISRLIDEARYAGVIKGELQ